MLKKHDKHYMEIAFLLATASKCKRAQYGSLIVASDGKRIIATGRNGKPAGSICDHLCFREGLAPNAPKDNCCLHSEVNTLLFSDPLDRKGGTLYVSGVPCNDCALVILQAGLARLVFWAGPTPHGHLGSSNDEFWNRYGGVLERVAYTHEKWEREFGGKSDGAAAPAVARRL